MQKHLLWSHNTVVLQTQSDESSLHLNMAAENSVSIEIICPEFESSRALIQYQSWFVLVVAFFVQSTEW